MEQCLCADTSFIIALHQGIKQNIGIIKSISGHKHLLFLEVGKV
jgi:hypothetical protein